MNRAKIKRVRQMAEMDSQRYRALMPPTEGAWPSTPKEAYAMSEYFSAQMRILLCDALLADDEADTGREPEYRCGRCGTIFRPGQIVGVAHGELVCYGAAGAGECVREVNGR